MAAAFSQINWSVPSWDLFIYLFFAIGAVLYGMALGRDRVLAMLISIYIGLAISSNLPFLNEKTAGKVGLSSVFMLRLLVFAAVLVLGFYVFSRVGLVSISSDSKVWHVFLFSFCQVGLLVSIVLSFLPSEILQSLNPFTRQVFMTEMARFLWILAPLAAMFFAKKTGEG